MEEEEEGEEEEVTVEEGRVEGEDTPQQSFPEIFVPALSSGLSI